MKLSAKSRYGLKAMYYLGKHDEGHPMPLKVLANFSEVSSPYLEKLMSILRNEKLINATRGVNGGYNLARDTKDISVGDIIRALEGEVLKVECLSGNCVNTKCPNKSIFTDLYYEINRVLDKTSLQTMIERDEEGSL